MKKHLFSIFSIVTILFTTSCNKKDLIVPPVSGTTTSSSYQPVSKGSTWTYTYNIGGSVQTVTMTMTGETSTFNGQKYYNCTAVSPLYPGGSTVGYYSENDGVYRSRGASQQANAVVDMLYLDNNKPVGGTWTAPINEAGQVNGVPGRFVGKIIAKGLSRTVGGKDFNDVIHCTVDLQYNMMGNGFESVGSYDYYVAKGIGLIELDFSAFGMLVSSQTVTTYSIK